MLRTNLATLDLPASFKVEVFFTAYRTDFGRGASVPLLEGVLPEKVWAVVRNQKEKIVRSVKGWPCIG